jgi:hypothetical protein
VNYTGNVADLGCYLYWLDNDTGDDDRVSANDIHLAKGLEFHMFTLLGWRRLFQVRMNIDLKCELEGRASTILCG